MTSEVLLVVVWITGDTEDRIQYLMDKQVT